jgi:hypothetical protein
MQLSEESLIQKGLEQFVWPMVTNKLSGFTLPKFSPEI